MPLQRSLRVLSASASVARIHASNSTTTSQKRSYCINLDSLGDMGDFPPPPPPPSAPGEGGPSAATTGIPDSAFDVLDPTEGLVKASERGQYGGASKTAFSVDWDGLNYGTGTLVKKLVRPFLERPNLPNMFEGKPGDYAVLKGLLTTPLPITLIMDKSAKELQLDPLADFNSQAIEFYQRMVEAQALTLVTIAWNPSVPSMCRCSAKPISEQLEALKELLCGPNPDALFWTKCCVNLRPNGINVVKQRFQGAEYSELINVYANSLPCPGDVFRTARACIAHDFMPFKEFEAKFNKGDTLDTPGGKKNLPFVMPSVAKGTVEKVPRNVSALQLVLTFPQYFEIRIQDDPASGQYSWGVKYTLWPAYFPHEVNKPIEELQAEVEEFNKEHSAMQREMKEGKRFRAKEVKNMQEMKAPLIQALEIKKRPSIYVDPNVCIYYLFDMLPSDTNFCPQHKDIMNALSKECRKNMPVNFIGKKKMKEYPRMLRIFDEDPPSWGLQRVDAPKFAGTDYSRLTHEDVKVLVLKCVNHPIAQSKNPDIRCGLSFLSTLLPNGVRERVKNGLGGWAAVCESFPEDFDLLPDGVSWKVKYLDKAEVQGRRRQ